MGLGLSLCVSLSVVRVMVVFRSDGLSDTYNLCIYEIGSMKGSYVVKPELGRICWRGHLCLYQQGRDPDHGTGRTTLLGENRSFLNSGSIDDYYYYYYHFKPRQIG